MFFNGSTTNAPASARRSATKPCGRSPPRWWKNLCCYRVNCKSKPGSLAWVRSAKPGSWRNWKKPGAHLLAFGGTRTFHRLAVAIEDAGWEVRDCLMWVYGSGFPKSLDVSKAIDKAAGAEREVIGKDPSKWRDASKYVGDKYSNMRQSDYETKASITAPATDDAKAWQGWGTALKPAYEPIIMARKPLTSTVAANVLQYGTGAINVDGCRVETAEGDNTGRIWRDTPSAGKGSSHIGQAVHHVGSTSGGNPLGRWPANVLHDGSDEVTALFPTTTSGGTPFSRPSGISYHGAAGQDDVAGNRGDSGSAARFFYCAKASKADRDEGCDDLATHKQDETRNEGDPGGDNPRNRGAGERSNHHPTVKPTDLMRYLCRLVTPPDGTVLDHFMGSGSTGKAATLEGFSFVGCELQPEYMAIAEARIQHAEGEVEPLLRVRT